MSTLGQVLIGIGIVCYGLSWIAVGVAFWFILFGRRK